LKYWTRQPYLGFGVDAHSMLPSAMPELDAVRFAYSDSLEKYVSGIELLRTPVTVPDAMEESFFLGLRLTRGIDLGDLAAKFGKHAIGEFRTAIAEMIEGGLLEQSDGAIRLTGRGRLLSNEVFERFLAADKAAR
jgi:oxygen-independent coproporphyrinogen-3 oxidase